MTISQEEIIGRRPVRMSYKSFDTRITKKYGVTVENWPQLPFSGISPINNPEHSIALYLLWKSGATRFKRLSPEEKEIWDATREKLQMERNKVTSPNLRSLPSRAFPSHRMLLDTKLLGTIDQISEFMFPSYAPKKCPRPRGEYCSTLLVLTCKRLIFSQSINFIRQQVGILLRTLGGLRSSALLTNLPSVTVF